MNTIDRLLGTMTMYRLALGALLVLTAAAFMLSFAGVLAFTPAELGGTLAVAVVSAWGGTRVMAMILRVRPHTESALITGLILFFVMFPASSAAGLGGIAVAGLAASASKYLLAFRGRHIFNPAAAGAVTATLLGVGAAAWWVATPYLLPLAAGGAVLLVYRTGKFPMGAVFVFVSSAILLAGIVSTGQAAGAALLLVLGSYPVIFLVGFMLTEPLTLPPRRWQQAVVAVVVAVLLGAQLSIGPVFVGPEFALLAGNAVAFLMGQRGGLRLTLVGRRELTPSSTELVFAPKRPVRFHAGQFMELHLPHERADRRGSRRVFSITSPPQETQRLTFGLRTSQPGSSFKDKLLGLREGQNLSGTLVAGDFRLPRNNAQPLLLVAGGIGITPFMSQLRDLAHRGEQRDLVLVYAVRSSAELAYLPELESLATPVALFSPDNPADAGIQLPPSWNWVGSGSVTTAGLLAAVPGIVGRRALVSGSPGFIAAVRKELSGAGCRHAHTDAFIGY